MSTGMPSESKEEVEVAARKLLEQGVKSAVLVKRGKNGSLLVTKDDSIEQDIFEANKVTSLLSSASIVAILLWKSSSHAPSHSESPTVVVCNFSKLWQKSADWSLNVLRF